MNNTNSISKIDNEFNNLVKKVTELVGRRILNEEEMLILLAASLASTYTYEERNYLIDNCNGKDT